MTIKWIYQAIMFTVIAGVTAASMIIVADVIKNFIDSLPGYVNSIRVPMP